MRIGKRMDAVNERTEFEAGRTDANPAYRRPDQKSAILRSKGGGLGAELPSGSSTLNGPVVQPARSPHVPA